MEYCSTGDAPFFLTSFSAKRRGRPTTTIKTRPGTHQAHFTLFCWRCLAKTATGIDCAATPILQHGSNENTNGLLRQYFPKGTDLSLYSQAYLNKVARQRHG